jgi:pimeloyl-ACP methyl ester carboxylesterase
VVDPHPSVYAPRSARHPHRARHPEGAGARWSTRLPLPPEILEPWLPGGRPGAPAYRGATRDTLAFACGWDVDLAAVTAPVWLWYGETDRMVPVEHGRWLHEHLPTSTLVVREGVGHLGTLMPYWGEILTTLGRGWVGSSA